jgi:diguanylate cyclase (GGDEF)-like protein/PAS domain S-box-containing protein
LNVYKKHRLRYTESVVPTGLAGIGRLWMKQKPVIVVICLLALFSLLLQQEVWAAKNEVTLGVLAFRPKPETLVHWQPTADYLTAKIGVTVRLEALSYAELEAAIREHRLDFVLTNPDHYVLMSKRNGLSSPLATLVEEQNGQPLSAFGGVIIARADRNDINSIADLHGKTVATPDTGSLGGYQAQAYELLQSGFSLPIDCKLLVTGMPHDKALAAVLEGRADAGFVRTGLIESLQHEGKLDIRRLKVINPRQVAGFPFLLSTRLYPEWPFAAMPEADEKLARQVAAALYTMPADARATQLGHYHGWAIPADYEPVRAALQELRLPPFDQVPSFTWRDIVEKNRYSIIIAAIGLVAVTFLMVLLVLSNRQLRIQRLHLANDITGRQAAEVKLREEAETRRQLLAALGEGVYGVDSAGRCTFVNPAALTKLGFSEAELLRQDQHTLFHHHRPDGQTYPVTDCPIHLTLQDGVTRHGEDWFFHRDGTGFPVGLTVAATERDGKRTGAVVVFRDISDHKRMMADLQNLATTDALTGLPNRRYFLLQLEQVRERMQRFAEPQVSLLMLDLDLFKRVNDEHGHAAGDAVLRHFAELVRGSLRKTDLAGRLGGEEFAIMLFGNDLASAIEFAERLRAQVGASVANHDGLELRITVSIGVTQLLGTDASADMALARADDALYKAKANGRNRVEAA